jgi:hypothetical protein
MRTAVLICTGLMLAGCNIVTSPKPLFFARDAEGQAQLRPGVWVEDKASCAFDSALPVDKWPDCIDSFVVRPGEILAAHDPAAPPGPYPPNHFKMLLARGDPAVMQVEISEPDAPPMGYVYGGVRPLKLDVQGRIVAYKMWLALCGPPPAPDPTGAHSTVATQAPLDGLVVDKKLENCVASTQGPVRTSVKLSEAWNDADEKNAKDHGDRAHWVRDGEK